MQSDGLDSAVPRKRLRSLIQQEILWERQRNHDNAQAFARILRLYLDNKFLYPVQSTLGFLDITNPASLRRWTVDTIFIVVDTERAVEAALKNDRALLEKFWQWFVLPEIESGYPDRPILTPEESRTYSRIVQACGRKFLRVGLYPTQKYFHRGVGQRQGAA